MKEAFQFLASVQEEKPRKYYAVKNGIVTGTHMLRPSQLKQFSISMGCTFMCHVPVALKGKDSDEK